MAVISYQSETGEPLWKAYVSVRSRNDRNVRVQRHRSGCKSEKEAQREELKLVRDCERELSELENIGSSWGKVIESWNRFQDNNPGVSKITQSDYFNALHKHTEHWWRRPACELTTADVRELLNQMKAHGCSNTFQAKMKNMINRVFGFGVESRLIQGVHRSPALGIQVARREEKKPEILTIAEVRKLLTEARRLNHPWFPVWAMALLTGMRSGELFAILWTDVDWDNKMLSINKSYNCRMREIKCTKSGHVREIPISSELMNLLRELKAEARDRKHILPRFSMWDKGQQAHVLRTFCEGYGLPSVKFHTLRACFATQLIRMGIAPAQVMIICGWNDLSTMQHYVRLAGIEVQGVTEALKVLPEPEIMAQVVRLYTHEPVTG